MMMPMPPATAPIMRCSKRRMVGDYEGDGLSVVDANDAIANAARFVIAVKEFLVGHQPNPQ